MESELVVIEKSNSLELFTTAKGLDPILAKIRQEIDVFVPDVSSRKGRESIASIAAKVARSKTYLDGVGKELVDRLKQQPKLIDEERKRIRDILDTWKDEVRLPLTEYENAEKARIEGIRKRMQHFHFAESREYLNSIEVQAEIDVITATVIDDSFEEFASEAAIAKDSTLSTLKKLFDVLLDRETKQAELDRLRKEQAEREQAERDERIAREAAAIAKREAEEKHKAALETAKRKEAEAKLKLETETKRLANEARQAAEAAEQRRLADIRAMEEAAAREKARLAREEQARIDAQAQAEAEERARQADKKHRAEIANEAAEALVAHADVEQAAARRIVNSIHKKLIPHVSIKF